MKPSHQILSLVDNDIVELALHKTSDGIPEADWWTVHHKSRLPMVVQRSFHVDNGVIISTRPLLEFLPSSFFEHRIWELSDLSSLPRKIRSIQHLTGHISD